MVNYPKQHFIFELKHQCNFAITAYSELNIAISNQNADKIWSSLELFLIAAAKISIIFWSQEKKYNERGEDLRNLLKVDENVAYKKTDPRNHLQHFDQRLEDWYAKSTHHNLADSNIFPETNFMTGNVDYLDDIFIELDIPITDVVISSLTLTILAVFFLAIVRTKIN
jgi:hypothetical protein